MEETVWLIGGVEVTAGMVLAALVLVVLLALVLLGLVFVQLRQGTRKAGDAAETAVENLRANFVQQIAERDGRIRDFDSRLTQQQRENSRLQAEAEGLRVRLAEQQKQAEENLSRFNAMRQQTTDEFKLIANDVLKSHGEAFSRQNVEQVDTLLKPLRDRIAEFHTGLMKDRAAMGEQIRALAESNMQITSEAQNLTRALKGNSQAQGAWGEMILSTILERSGLREGEQYFTQTSHTGEGNQRLRTDVEVLMPNADRLIIDSKVSLTAFEQYCNTEDGTERERHLQAHCVSMRNHIRILGDKTYHRHAGSGLDYVMMFVPIESAFSAAIGADAKLIEYGIEQGVMLTTPTTLLTVLRTVRNVWDIEKRHQNAEEIADRAGKLFDKVTGFLSTMDKLGENLTRAQRSYDDAKGQLSTGAGNVVRQVSMLRELGAKTSKQLPDGWTPEDEPSASIARLEPRRAGNED